MRTIRALTTAALITALPGLAAAQEGRQFKDSWFWGFKTGGSTYADSSGGYSAAPVVGFEWLITRTHGGLYIAGSQAFFSTQTIFGANPGTQDANFRTIELSNVRRLDFAAVGFPGTHVRLHPYFGGGFTMQQVPRAVGQGPFNSQSEFEATQALIAETRVSFAPLLMVGAQYRLRPVSVFGQFMLLPTQKNFILYNGRAMNSSIEFGVRYNIGSSIARD
jgi:hypothetical protein